MADFALGGQILRAAADGEIAALVVGGLEVADLPDPELARRALDRRSS